jgi:hypothetical protein
MTQTTTPAPEPAPSPLRRAARQAYRQATTATATLRLTPGFLMIGVQRCGTTSLFQALTEHPQVMRPAFRKGIYYFDLNYHRGDQWYHGHFPTRWLAHRKAARYGPPVAFEASGYYIYHPFALDRIAADLPTAKLVVMLRDPVERAYSAYKHEYARGYEPERSFERALELEDGRLVGEVERMRADPRYESMPHRHHSYRHRGQYAEQLERVFALFPRTQVHIVQSEAFFAQPAEEYGKLLEFLGLHPFDDVNFGRYKARPGGAMSPETVAMLREHYAPHDERLAKLLGREPLWSQ